MTEIRPSDKGGMELGAAYAKKGYEERKREEKDKIYCYCRKPENGRINCRDKLYMGQRFHLEFIKRSHPQYAGLTQAKTKMSMSQLQLLPAQPVQTFEVSGKLCHLL